jgi:hypothetical protein
MWHGWHELDTVPASQVSVVEMGVISTNNHTQNLASPIGEMVSLSGVPAPGTTYKAETFQ